MRRAYTGPTWRHVPAGAHPLNLQFLLQAGGRWNRRGEYGALYTSLSPGGVAAEFRKYLSRRGLGRPRDLVRIEVGVAPVLDLVGALATGTEEVVSPLTGRTVGLLAIPPERLESDEPEDLEACRELADWARGQEFLALLVPSAAAPKRTNLVIFPENRPREISLRETSVRVALNYGPDPFLDEAGRPTRKEP